MDFTKINYYEFDYGSELTRARCLDTCKLNLNYFFDSNSVWVSNILLTFLEFGSKPNVDVRLKLFKNF